jgi:hypothetical protein
MTVHAPAYLLLLAAAPLAAALCWSGSRRACEAVEALTGPARGRILARTVRAKRAARGTLLAVAVALLSLAAADLRWGREPAPASPGQEVTMLLDLSYSMRAADVRPSRLHAGVAVIEGSAAVLDAAAVGLTVFRGDTLDLVPPTTDRDALSNVLAHVIQALPPAPTPAQVDAPGWRDDDGEAAMPVPLPAPGSDISRALEQVLARIGGQRQVRHTVVLVTDGEVTMDNRFGRAAFRAGTRAALAAAGPGVVLLPVVIGTPDGIGLMRADGRPVLDAAGNAVTTRARPATGPPSSARISTCRWSWPATASSARAAREPGPAPGSCRPASAGARSGMGQTARSSPPPRRRPGTWPGPTADPGSPIRRCSWT